MRRAADFRASPAYPFVCAAALLLIGLLLVVQAAHWARSAQYGDSGTIDWLAYWGAGQLFRHGEDPYNAEKLQAIQRSIDPEADLDHRVWNPPHLLVLLYPLYLPSFYVSTLLWLVVSFGLFLGSTLLVWLALDRSSGRESLGWALLSLLAFIPAFACFKWGQISGLALVGLAGFLYLCLQRRDLGAGACIALTTIKPHVVYLVWIALFCWVVSQRRWRVALGVVLLLALCLVLVLVMDPAALTGYRAILNGPPVHLRASTLGAALRQWIAPDVSIIQFLPALATAVGFAGFFLVRRPALRWDRALSPLLLLSVATAPYGWHFDQALLLIPYLQMVFWLVPGSALPSGRSKAVALAGLVLTMAAMFVQSMTPWGDLMHYFWVPWALGAVYLYAAIPGALGEESAGPSNQTSDGAAAGARSLAPAGERGA